MITMPRKQVKLMDPLFSGHSSLSINIEEKKGNNERPFRFYNYLAHHQEFESRVRTR